MGLPFLSFPCSDDGGDYSDVDGYCIGFAGADDTDVYYCSSLWSDRRGKLVNFFKNQRRGELYELVTQQNKYFTLAPDNVVTQEQNE